ncbi:coiled-coil domain-containing protein 12 [Schistocerca americana]|uniref:coiled-coil domain-containing protein 12 n=1 Tax=Schistocerca americana TaxID=7009 RepID=UPI001F4F6E3F|nr:coiled-coil domain-containing protein 12 [Schistocerca americana]XP_047100579.1 coiled-coil domain-containing protein 12 [Schistocerca piceifrons]XP_049770636.1 coiled-coil domain-containing protein 12 [Schistocerca cancellata]XP_049797730.1 coiled-coil domain-containing protein 12 [Schistocerca nitens]XP_049842600.1 coiled-coil domain-containing protein 12 [Schistocerca gregaria]XP_049946334.1 coiled-coil domain-containing protein 12 [Schistocerca serialis cubense]
MEQEDKVGCMEAEALKRKERLKQLKRKHEEVKDGTASEEKSESVSVLPKPKFRSYRPQDETLKENVVPEAKPGDVEEEVKDQLSSAHSKVVIEELDITNLAPRKPDWDLKRDVAKKLERLERRTQKAIAELIRDRLRKGQEDLANSVNAGARINQMDAANED